MKLINIMIATLIATSYAAGAQAQNTGTHDSRLQDKKAKESGVYANLGVISYDEDLPGIEAKLGYNFNKYLGVETQGSIGTDRDNRFSTPPESLPIGLKVNYNVAAFAIARYPLFKKFEVFARAGVSNTQLSLEVGDDSTLEFDQTETGIAIGAGGQYIFDRKNGIRFEYTRLDEVDADTVSLAYVRKF